MKEKNSKVLSEQELENVSGGANAMRYSVGQTVQYVVFLHSTAMRGRVRLTGTIIGIDGNRYIVRSNLYTHFIEEQDIRTPPKSEEFDICSTENGAHGSW